MNSALAKVLYLGIQSLRSGVSVEMIRHASRVLSGEIAWHAHVEARLKSLYSTSSHPLLWLAQQPLTDRTTIIAEGLPRVPTRTRVETRKTSGSTGVPFHFLRDRTMTAQMDAAMWAAYAWHGIYPGDRQARFWGLPVGRIAANKRRITDAIQNRRRLSAFDVTRGGCRTFYKRLLTFRPKYIYGYPTLIYEFIQHCKAEGYDGSELGIRTVICTGELLAPTVRDEIRFFFDARVVNEYGCTESGVLSFTCEVGSEHVLPVATYPELVSDRGVPVSPGESGQVVITDLYGEVMPLRRYKLNDIAVWAKQSDCNCGRPLPRLEVQCGRVDGFVLTPEGKRVYDALLAYTVPRGILRFSVRQEDVNHLHALIIPGEGFHPEATPNECIRVWEGAFGPGMRVTVEVVQDIPLASSGKLRYFIPLETYSRVIGSSD